MRLFKHSPILLLKDSLLIFVMAMLAGCGLVYEYLLSHYAGRILGAYESAVFTMIGLMIVSMGVGAFAARGIRDPFKGFVWLEVIIALLGACSILFIAAVIGITYTLPQLLTDTFSIPPDVLPRGGWLASLNRLALKLPYVAGVLLGIFVGMEIPLIARVREELYGQHLQHNAGTIYGADYIGAGIGAAIWIAVLMSIDISTAAAYTASINVLAGFIFLALFWSHIRFRRLLLVIHVLLAVLVAKVSWSGQSWLEGFTDALYQDKVVYQQQTRYQQLVFTERDLGPALAPVYEFFLNGRLQFSSRDEHIYHEMLVHPAMMSAARTDKVLIIGGGDGLALREVFKWPVSQVELVDLDPALIALFKQPAEHLPARLANYVLEAGDQGLNDPRLNLHFADAFLQVDALLREGNVFDVIIVDLPDPNHPDLNKLYSRHFYLRLNQLLSGDGVVVIQSTSPYHAQHAFLSIGKTLSASGFSAVEQYHQNVPSFGEWGWTIATKRGWKVSERLLLAPLTVPTRWLTKPLINSAFVFPAHFYQALPEIKVNDLGSHVLYQYHHQAWRKHYGTVFSVSKE